MKLKSLILLLCLLPAALFAQTARQGAAIEKNKPPSKNRAAKHGATRFTFPIAAATGRVTYQDTVQAPGLSEKMVLDRAMDGFRRNFPYTDWPISPADTAGLPKAGPNEIVTLGSMALFGPNPPPVYVAGVSPPANLANYPPYRLVHFVLRLHAEPGVCSITVTNLRVRTARPDQEMQRQLAAYGLARNPKAALPPKPISQPIEKLYAAWMPDGANAGPSEPLPTSDVPTEAQAREAHAVAGQVSNVLRRSILR